MQILLLFLSLLDVLAGLAIIYPGSFFFAEIILFYFALFQGGKGIWTVLTSFASGFYFELLGAIDVISGVALFAIYSGISFNLFWILGAVVLIKGAYGLLFSLS